MSPTARSSNKRQPQDPLNKGQSKKGRVETEPTVVVAPPPPIVVHAPTANADRSLWATRAPFNEAKLDQAIVSYFGKPPHVVFDQNAHAAAHVYRLDEVFGVVPWTDRIRKDRVDSNSAILYRPQIVDDLVIEINNHLQSSSSKGIFVTGAQGIGKSHSLINLVRWLQASGDYLVTFVPNCDAWKGFSILCRFVLESFDSTEREIDLSLNPDLVAQTTDDCRELIEAVNSTLKRLDKKWILIFDQVNRLLKIHGGGKNDISALPPPFNFLNVELQKRGRILPIISASVNNEIAVQHPDFDEFLHPVTMSVSEIRLLYTGRFSHQNLAQKSDNDITEMLHATGLVPLYINRYFQKPDEFEMATMGEIKRSLSILEESLPEKVRGELAESCFYCAIGLENARIKYQVYDRKFTIAVKEGSKERFPVPLLPLVCDAYSTYFGDWIREYIGKKEDTFLKVCADPEVTQATRGYLYQNILTNRLRTEGFLLVEPFRSKINQTIARVNKYIYLSENMLPGATVLHDDNTYCMFIPTTPNFPAVDLIVRAEAYIIGIQYHVSADRKWKKDLMLFGDLIKESGMKDLRLHYLYISPTNEVRNALQEMIVPKVRAMVNKTEKCDSLIWLKEDNVGFLTAEDVGIPPIVANRILLPK